MRYFNIKNRLAFSMIEVIFAIIILGILAALAMPRLERDIRQEAADEILSQIRYTQHLALMDDKHLFNNPKWQRRYWKIMFATCNDNGTNRYFFRIGSDDDMNSTSTFEKNEAAIDPINGKPYYMRNNASCDDQTVSNNIFIGKKYGITTVTGGNACNGVKHIGFDHLGRPHIGFSNSNTPDYSSYISANQACRFTFTLSDGDTFSIDIAPETGYANIVNQNNS